VPRLTTWAREGGEGMTKGKLMVLLGVVAASFTAGAIASARWRKRPAPEQPARPDDEDEKLKGTD
jgi:hypothetical protein